MTARRARGSEPKRDVTRRHLLECALALFQSRGVEETTMREIARAAGLSLGAAYYHFPSKEALIHAYYEETHAGLDALAARATGTPRERLGILLHGRLELLAPYRSLLRAIVHRVIDPADPLSALSADGRALRERSIGQLTAVLAELGLSPKTVQLVGELLWLATMALLLVFVHDDSPAQARSHGLIDEALELVWPLLPFLDTPFGQGIADRLAAMVAMI